MDVEVLDTSACIEGATCRPTKDCGRNIVTAGRPDGTNRLDGGDRSCGFLDNIVPLMVFVALLKRARSLPRLWHKLWDGRFAGSMDA